MIWILTNWEICYEAFRLNYQQVIKHKKKIIMKKILFIAIPLFLFMTSIQAQQDRGRAQRQERIQTFKVAFFSEKLQLTPEESKNFWPLFNQFEEKQEALREKYNLRGQRLEFLSDIEVKEHVMNQLEMEHEVVKVRKDYTMQFMDVLPIRKVAMLQRVNREFKKELLKEMRERRQNRQGGNK